MPKNLTAQSKRTTKPAFKSETDEADWYHSPEGREHAKRALRKAIRTGRITLAEKVSVREASQLAATTGKVVVVRKGVATDPAGIQKLLDDARATMTKAISLRIPVSEIEAAKSVAAKRGIGYQTVLKDIISKGLRKAS